MDINELQWRKHQVSFCSNIFMEGDYLYIYGYRQLGDILYIYGFKKEDDALKMMNLKPKQKKQIEAIQEKISKQDFYVKIELYIQQKKK